MDEEVVPSVVNSKTRSIVPQLVGLVGVNWDPLITASYVAEAYSTMLLISESPFSTTMSQQLRNYYLIVNGRHRLGGKRRESSERLQEKFRNDR